ncbi:MAG: aminotransferase class V-fold PLP-dependent enzyme [Bdellovibrionaceae bacterium]|nr:aminotransferase class V-fold PLP-dependent enzyme [Pseudobdellovibrionaceae bacterium]MBX3032867.1 aminotransferase class V-fold PLP-dependent enzyme [Pseudobdellovibrionaceae bacterium]
MVKFELMDFREAFSLDSQWVQLNNAGHGPFTRAAEQAAIDVSRRLASLGAQAIPELYAELTATRSVYADFLGTHVDRIAYTANLASAASLVAWGLPFREGDGILTIDQEYPSNAYIWHSVARARNLKLEVFQSNADTSIHWDAFLARIRPGVRAVVLSWVQYGSGETAPLPAIGEACRRAGAWFVLDGVQGLGALKFDFASTGVDILCGASHKWMCGPAGHGFLAFKDELYLQMTPVLQGAMTFGTPDDAVDPQRSPVATARRFEPGAPAFLMVAAAAASLREIRKVGVEAIERTNRQLSQQLRQGLQARGLTIIGSPDHPGRSSIVTVRPRQDLKMTSEFLLQKKISHAVRAGGIRLSPHAFNTTEEIERVFQAFE